jgi:hypothetical protein
MLQERAAAEALAGNEQEAIHILRRLERAEATKACFRLLRQDYLKPRSSRGLTQGQREWH